MIGAMLAEPQTQPEREAGLECPRCACKHFECVQTRQKRRYIYRRKRCRNCGKLVSTTERIVGG